MTNYQQSGPDNLHMQNIFRPNIQPPPLSLSLSLYQSVPLLASLTISQLD